MERFLLDDLLKWKIAPRRKPLILGGQRQVGKTWLLERFGRNHYDNVAYFNFEEDPALGGIFESTRNTKRILNRPSGQRVSACSATATTHESRSGCLCATSS